MGQKYAAYDAAGAITGFYDDAISPVPAGVPAIALTSDQYRTLLDAQAAGKRMAVTEGNAPVALDPLPPTTDQLANTKRVERDAALAATDWLVARHQDETLLARGTTLTADQFASLLAYRKALRDLPRAVGWPNVELPAAPDFAPPANA